mmetsp:Transcript_3956/g.10404  ORF Transcript_3956/g.10404 Transcript_3956/m.10404 type:complete len:268 (+) Transcript_3956:1008-1811(+)
MSGCACLPKSRVRRSSGAASVACATVSPPFAISVSRISTRRFCCATAARTSRMQFADEKYPAERKRRIPSEAAMYAGSALMSSRSSTSRNTLMGGTNSTNRCLITRTWSCAVDHTCDKKTCHRMCGSRGVSLTGLLSLLRAMGNARDARRLWVSSNAAVSSVAIVEPKRSTATRPPSKERWLSASLESTPASRVCSTSTPILSSRQQMSALTTVSDVQRAQKLLERSLYGGEYSMSTRNARATSNALTSCTREPGRIMTAKPTMDSL